MKEVKKLKRGKMESKEKTPNGIRKFFYIFVLVLTILLLSYYIYKNFTDFSQIRIVNPFSLILLVIIFISDFYLLALFTKFLLVPFNVQISTKEAFGLSVLTRFYNLISIFRGGTLAKAVYLKKKYKLSYTEYIANMSALYIIIFLVGSFSGLASMLLLRYYSGIFNSIIFLLFLGTFICLLAITIFSPKLPDIKNRWLGKFVIVINSWHEIRKDKKIILLTVLVSFAQLILSALGTIVVYNIFGVNVEFTKAIFIVSLSSLSIVIAITPGNLGIGDAVSIFSANIMGIALNHAVAAAILLRIINIIGIIILTPIFSYSLMKELSNEKSH